MDNLFTIIGTESYLVRQEINKILTKLEANEDNTIVFDMEEQTIYELVEELQTIPFLEDKKIIVVNNPNFLDKELEYRGLIEYMKNPLDTSFLIINALNNKWNKHNKHIETLELYTKIIRTKEVESLEEYARNYIEENNMNIDDKCLGEILSRVSDVGILINELEKLYLYKLNEKITLNDINMLVSKSLEDDVYELSHAFLNKDKKRVFSIYSNLLNHNEDSIRIMNVLIRKFIEILNTKLLISQNQTKDEIAAYFNVKPGRAYYMIKNANEIDFQTLKKNIDDLANLDYEIKSGKIDKNLGLEMFLLK